MLLTVFLLTFVIFAGGMRRFSLMIYMSAPILFYILCSFTVRGGSVLLWGYQSILLVMPVFLGYYFLGYRPENIKIFTATIIIATILTTITTMIGLIEFPSASRTLATISSVNDTDLIKYTWRNIGGYDFVYTSVLLYPILILAYKTKKIHPILFWGGVIMLFSLVILSEYTTALILIMLTSLLYFMGKRTSSKRLLLFGVGFFLALIIMWPLFSKFLLWLAELLNSDILSSRITALANGSVGLESYDDQRINLYMKSISGFLKSPFFGRILGGELLPGGHSFILDTLCNYGIIGGAALVLSYRNIYRYFFKLFDNQDGYGYIIWAFAQAIILSSVNTGMWLNVIAFFIPIILSAIYKTNSEDIYEDSLDS
jgi:hypothetical protein